MGPISGNSEPRMRLRRQRLSVDFNTLLWSKIRWRYQEREDSHGENGDGGARVQARGKTGVDARRTPVTKPEFKDGPKPDSKDDLKSVTMTELQKKLGSSPGGPQSSRSAEAAGTIWP